MTAPVPDPTLAEGLAEDVEALCVLFHDAYEAAAVGAGWETQERSRVPWADVPEPNKATMHATIRAFLASDWLREDREHTWQQGYTSGHSNAMRRMSDEPNAPTTSNPYRAEATR